MRELLRAVAGLNLPAFVGLNLLGFTAYRWAFLGSFAPSEPTLPILLTGARLDLALLGLEASVPLLVASLRGQIRLRRVRLFLGGLTVIHAGVCFASYQFFAERDQHMWEMLLANLSRPDQIAWAVAPLIAARWPVAAAAAAAWLLFLAGAVAWARRAPPEVSAWRGRRRLTFALAVGILVVSNLDPVRVKREAWNFGWLPLLTASHYYMGFDAYAPNQAVVNPLHDLVRYYAPASLVGWVRSRAFGVEPSQLDPEWALEHALATLGLDPLDPRYPLLRTVSAEPGLGLRNVVLIEVEGLGSTVVLHEEAGRPVMPFLRGLLAQGLFFPNFFQSTNSTDGSVFASTTSLPKTFAELRTGFFLPHEVNGRFGSLPRILGPSHRHVFLQAFRQRSDDFVSFMGNQGHETWGYEALRARIAASEDSEAAGNALGIFDHRFLEEAAAILAEDERPFTAHLVTSTSHSPWVIPADAPRPFADSKLDTFHYVDASLARFVALLTLRPDFEATLLVIVGDHTSLTFGTGLLERLRVPLILAGPAIEDARERFASSQEVRGSHVDILPTILHLLGGTHPYAGMGRSLLADETDRGILSGTRYKRFYIRDRFTLRHDPFAPSDLRLKLHPFNGRDIARKDRSRRHPKLRERLKTEFLAQYETARRLVREQRIYPPAARE